MKTTAHTISIDYITTTQAAVIIGCTADHVRHLLQTGQLDGIRLGRDWAVSAAAANAFQRRPVGNPNFVSKPRKKQGKKNLK